VIPKIFLSGKGIETSNKAPDSFLYALNGRNRYTRVVLRSLRICDLFMEPAQLLFPVGMGAIDACVPGHQIHLGCIEPDRTAGHFLFPEIRTLYQPDHLFPGVPAFSKPYNSGQELDHGCLVHLMSDCRTPGDPCITKYFPGKCEIFTEIREDHHNIGKWCSPAV